MNTPENRQKLSIKKQVEFPKNLDEMFQLGNLPQSEFNDMLENLARVSNIGEEKQKSKKESRVSLVTMFKTVWNITPGDSKLFLLRDILTIPGSLERMYHNEMVLQRNLNSHWKK